MSRIAHAFLVAMYLAALVMEGLAVRPDGTMVDLSMSVETLLDMDC